MVRAFVAIDLVASLREAFSLVQEPLKTCSGRLAIVDPSLLHITLKFLGEVPADQVRGVGEVLHSVESSPFTLRICGISSNNPKRPRVIWAVVEDGGRTGALANEIDAALEPLGFSREKRPFRPHITLARVKEYHPDIPVAIDSLSDWVCGEMEVAGFVLKKSTLTPRGPIYETITEVPL
ncbi:RNA 2',3'-cyclic phosphodiesterase [Methanocalculus taiwanensis]|uniref:RNA 2',3'-cyclic phosphodiesterase n=1 Tax=Methanocalculus taiwanensis TaxID=106207 RepID=A0ABD4TPA2_9EURY|nr:RNA 2',3'-cyclic phosphodiesterase [Methanocalculus taiwanensis]MCQ1539105.1 RNA 2',3'-cyclic phosphodiesterase [Methanocalculus taiwanensis]